MTVPEDEIGKLQVVLTVVDGKIVFEQEGALR